MSLFTVAAYSMSAFLAGLLVFLVAPLILAELGDYQAKTKILRRYVAYATKANERTVLLAREHGGLDWLRSSFDARRGEETVTSGGQELRFNDAASRMSRLRTRPFGIAHESFATFVDARDLTLGEQAMEHKQSGDLEPRGSFAVDGDLRAAAPDAARRVVQGSTSPTDSESAATFIEHSLAKYRNTGDLIRVTVLAMLFLAGFVPVWYVGSNGGGGGGAPPTNPVPIMMDLVGVML